MDYGRGMTVMRDDGQRKMDEGRKTAGERRREDERKMRGKEERRDKRANGGRRWRGASTDGAWGQLTSPLRQARSRGGMRDGMCEER